jgi:hypothetical protein
LRARLSNGRSNGNRRAEGEATMNTMITIGNNPGVHRGHRVIVVIEVRPSARASHAAALSSSDYGRNA